MENLQPTTNGLRYELNLYCNPHLHTATAEIYDTQRRIKCSASSQIWDIHDHERFYRMRGSLFKALGANPEILDGQMTHPHRIKIRGEQLIVFKLDTNSLK